MSDRLDSRQAAEAYAKIKRGETLTIREEQALKCFEKDHAPKRRKVRQFAEQDSVIPDGPFAGRRFISGKPKPIEGQVLRILKDEVLLP